MAKQVSFEFDSEHLPSAALALFETASRALRELMAHDVV